MDSSFDFEVILAVKIVQCGMMLENDDEWRVDRYLDVDILGLFEVFVETEKNHRITANS